MFVRTAIACKTASSSRAVAAVKAAAPLCWRRWWRGRKGGTGSPPAREGTNAGGGQGGTQQHGGSRWVGRLRRLYLKVLRRQRQRRLAR